MIITTTITTTLPPLTTNNGPPPPVYNPHHYHHQGQAWSSLSSWPCQTNLNTSHHLIICHFDVPSTFTMPSNSKHRSTHLKVGIGSSSQVAVKVYATTAEAITNFKPTHCEVISGIAPHVFDEWKSRWSQWPWSIIIVIGSALPEEHLIHFSEHYFYCFQYQTNTLLDQPDVGIFKERNWR